MLLETNKKQQRLRAEEIAYILPHSNPFLFLDSATLSETGARGTFTIEHDLDFLNGHFKHRPVFPASLMTEALGQLGVLFLLQTNSPQLILPVNPEQIMFISSERISCHKICVPGETLELNITAKLIRHPIFRFDGKIYSGDKKVASAEGISLAFDYLQNE